MVKNYVGFANSFHDSAMAIVDSQGRIVFAEATERPLQNKRAINISPDLFDRVERIVRLYGEQGAEIVIANSWSDSARTHVENALDQAEKREHKLVQIFGAIPDILRPSTAFNKFSLQSHVGALAHVGRTLEYELSTNTSTVKHRTIRRSYDHHLTHAATAAFTSGFSEAACAIIDGSGESSANTSYRYMNGQLEEINRGESQNFGSLGLFFQWICHWCGFGYFAGEEWKVMGLAPYGRDDEGIYRIIRELIDVKDLNIQFCSDARQFRLFQSIYPFQRRKGEPPEKAADLARAGQKVFTEIMIQYLTNLHKLDISDNLVLGGGCALNSAANGAILGKCKFKRLYVPSAPADDGNAVGAALLAFSEDHPSHHRLATFQSPYLGSQICTDSLDRLLEFGGFRNATRLRSEVIPRKAAEYIANGKIIGWIQGRAEFGPRALGNRSILADPRTEGIKDQLNKRVKFREEFRPFAPSILHESGPEYFEDYQESPYMERALRFRPEVIHKVPGVVHKDGTGRLQSVKLDWNPRFYKLIYDFNDITGIPLVLNTSFNLMGKPIAHSLEDAIALFCTTGIDCLFIEDVVIEKFDPKPNT